MSAVVVLAARFGADSMSQKARLAPFHWSHTLASLTTPEEARTESINHVAVHHVPWNKGKLVRQKAPLKQRGICVLVEAHVKSLIACLASGVLVSCAVIDHDATHDPIAAEIAGQCFALQQDVWIVKESLIPVRYTFFIPTQICTAPDGALSSGTHCYVNSWRLSRGVASLL
jgi:hypothetical protein